MAYAFVSTRGATNSKTSGTTLARAPSANITVGQIAIVAAVADNTTTTDGESDDLSIADAQGNTWVKIVEFTESSGAAGDGITVAFWKTVVTTQIGTGDNITITHPTIDARGMVIAVFTGTDALEAQTGTDNDSTGTSATPAVSSLASKEYLLFGLVGVQGPTSESFTEDTDGWTNIGGDTWGTTGGSGGSNVCGHLEYKIATTTGDQWDPAWTTNRAHAAVLSALQEDAGGGGGGGGGGAYYQHYYRTLTAR